MPSVWKLLCLTLPKLSRFGVPSVLNAPSVPNALKYHLKFYNSKIKFYYLFFKKIYLKNLKLPI